MHPYFIRTAAALAIASPIAFAKGETATEASTTQIVNCSIACPTGACQNVINSHLAAGYDVQLVHGQTCSIDGKIEVLANRSLFGDGLPRPIIQTSGPGIVKGAIGLGSNSLLSTIDLRGPHYGQPVGYITKEDQKTLRDLGLIYYGINGSSDSFPNYNDDWVVSNVSVQGFPDNGIHVGASRGVSVQQSQIKYNGASGIALFRVMVDSLRGSDATITNNQIHYNGQDGIDSGFMNSLFESNSIWHNGWLNAAGDRSGILLCSEVASAHSGTVIRLNSLAYNDEQGIRLNGTCGTPIDDVEIWGNIIYYNDQGGIRKSGTLSNADIGDNSFSGNGGYGVSLQGVQWNVYIYDSTASSWPVYNCIDEGESGVTYSNNTCS